jgi:hypothetical protein
MTQNKNFKKLVKQHAAKTGKSYTAALRDFVDEASAPLAEDDSGKRSLPDSSGVEALLLRLQSSSFGVLVGRVPAMAGSANLAIAQAHARDLAVHPKFFAESGLVEMIITPAELEALVATGAARSPDVQVIRSFKNDHGVTFSEDCQTCRRWIWCGDTERETTCACGQVYRVVFDLAPQYHWTKAAGPRCLDCGSPYSLTEPSEQRNPWRMLNEWQMRCHACASRELTIVAICDYETSAHAGAMGAFQVISLEEEGRDLTYLIDQGTHYFSLEQLRRDLQKKTGNPVDLTEV